MESASGKITRKDAVVLEHGHVICNMNSKTFDKNSWHASSGEGVPRNRTARDYETERSP